MAVTDAPPSVRINPISPFLIGLVDCVCNEVKVHGAGEVCWCGLYPGFAVSLEYCTDCGNDKCGMAWVRPALANPSDSFPTGTIDTTCVHELAWSVEVGTVRCMPILEDGELLAPDAMAHLAIDQMQDAWALYLALTCCDLPRVAIQQWTPIGPDGGCVGGFWTAWIASS